MKRQTVSVALLAAFLFCTAGVSHARYYDPESGRFISRDPVNTVNQANLAVAQSPYQVAAYPRVGQIASAAKTGPVRIGGGMITPQPQGRMIGGDSIETTPYVDGPNLYQYVRANPFVYVDSWGLMSKDFWDKCCKDTGDAEKQLKMMHLWASRVDGQTYPDDSPIVGSGCGYCSGIVLEHIKRGFERTKDNMPFRCWEAAQIYVSGHPLPPFRAPHAFVGVKPNIDGYGYRDKKTLEFSPVPPVFDGWDRSSNILKECHFSVSTMSEYYVRYPIIDWRIDATAP